MWWSSTDKFATDKIITCPVTLPDRWLSFNSLPLSASSPDILWMSLCHNQKGISSILVEGRDWPDGHLSRYIYHHNDLSAYICSQMQWSIDSISTLFLLSNKTLLVDDTPKSSTLSSTASTRDRILIFHIQKRWRENFPVKFLIIRFTVDSQPTQPTYQR